jgi:DNA-binding CsgD family transcriptional regulator
MTQSNPRARLVVAPSVVQQSPEARALPLIELISRASTEPGAWQELVEALSAELDDAAIALTLELPHTSTPMLAYRAKTLPEYTEVFAGYLRRGQLPWSLADVSSEAFCDLGDFAPARDLRATDFYREYMAPQGLAPEPPLGHIFARADRRPLAGIAVYRRVGGRPFTPADLGWLDLFVPHLSQAYYVHSKLLGFVHRGDAYQDVIDRFPTGVILIDTVGGVVASNRAARRIADLEDGFSLANDRACATGASSDVELQQAVREVLELPIDSGRSFDQGFTLCRPSGMREFSVVVTNILAASEIGAFDDAVAAIFIADPEFRQLGMRSLLGSFHKLTEAELELAALLCEGETLESAARVRGISPHTARSQLKRIFQKTNTSRQADLVGLVTGGLTKLRGH